QLLRAQISATIAQHPTKRRTGRRAMRAIGLVLLSIILAMVIVPPALAKAKRAQSARAQQGYQSSERPDAVGPTFLRNTRPRSRGAFFAARLPASRAPCYGIGNHISLPAFAC